MKYLRIALVFTLMCLGASAAFAVDIKMSASITPILAISDQVYSVPAYMGSNYGNPPDPNTAGVYPVSSMSFGALSKDPSNGYYAPSQYYIVQLFPSYSGSPYRVTQSSQGVYLNGSMDLRDFITEMPLYADKDLFKNSSGAVVGINGPLTSGAQVGNAYSTGADSTTGKIQAVSSDVMTMKYLETNNIPIFVSATGDGTDHIVQVIIGFYTGDYNHTTNKYPLGLDAASGATYDPNNPPAFDSTIAGAIGNHMITDSTLATNKVFATSPTTQSMSGTITFTVAAK